MKKTEIVIGSRESQLAVLQSQMVQKYIQDAHPEASGRNPHHENHR